MSTCRIEQPSSSSPQLAPDATRVPASDSRRPQPRSPVGCRAAVRTASRRSRRLRRPRGPRGFAAPRPDRSRRRRAAGAARRTTPSSPASSGAAAAAAPTPAAARGAARPAPERRHHGRAGPQRREVGVHEALLGTPGEVGGDQLRVAACQQLRDPPRGCRGPHRRRPMPSAPDDWCSVWSRHQCRTSVRSRQDYRGGVPPYRGGPSGPTPPTATETPAARLPTEAGADRDRRRRARARRRPARARDAHGQRRAELLPRPRRPAPPRVRVPPADGRASWTRLPPGPLHALHLGAGACTFPGGSTPRVPVRASSPWTSTTSSSAWSASGSPCPGPPRCACGRPTPVRRSSAAAGRRSATSWSATCSRDRTPRPCS